MSENFCSTEFSEGPCGIIIANIPSAVVVMEKPDGRVTYANPKAIEIHGVNPCGLAMSDHASKLRILTLDGKVYLTEDLYTYRALYKGESVSNAAIMIERPDGKRFIVNVSTRPVRNEQGEIFAAVAIFDDITSQRAAEEALKESEERYRILINASPDAIAIHMAGKLIYANPAGLALFGAKESKDVEGKSILDFVAPTERQKVISRISRAVTAGETAPLLEEELLRLDGTSIMAEVIATPIKYRGQTAVQVILRDITQRKVLEKKLQLYTEHLEELVNEKTQQLKASEQLAAIGQVAGMVGHDIKSPIQAITNELYLAKQAADNNTENKSLSEMLESITNIQEQVNYINQVLTDLQDYSKPLNPSLQNVNLCQAIMEAIKTIRVPTTIEKIIQCPEETFPLDLTLFRRIIINLANNAIQAMPNGGKLIIQAFKSGETATIIVEDTGQGIPRNLLPKLFTPLFTTKAKGQGFGLAAVKRMTEALNGKVSFYSEEGKGTKFLLEFHTPAHKRTPSS
ncbi:MAG TPA: PAS domain S-box protein [Candidatus Sulfotelmatobacter sp.]|nr:PAS domain S-box protein [Candidatus Sulfotelmatobacter sp.]